MSNCISGECHEQSLMLECMNLKAINAELLEALKLAYIDSFGHVGTAYKMEPLQIKMLNAIAKAEGK